MEMVGTPKTYGIGETPVQESEDILPIRADQKDLPMRRMQDSYQEVIIPLGQDYQVREKYITFMKGLRFGRIMEDLDTFAGNKVSRLEESQKSLLKTPPNEAEREIIHNIFLNTIDQKKQIKVKDDV
nr:hypothetical protein BaRGS_028837 [Batillaria attramentaria]